LENDIMGRDTTPIRILVADDHPAMREGIRTMIERQGEMQVVAEAGNGEEAVACFLEQSPDVVLLDLQMPRMDGLQTIAAIHAMRAETPIVVLTSYPGEARVSRALAAGAISYILKTSTRAQICDAIRGALKGRRVLDQAVTSDMEANIGHEGLNLREINVLSLVAIGKQNSEIGRALFVTEHAIKARLKNILAKLNASDRTHAVSIARKRGFLDY
jgi:DNA-binding NarL/FixJ family response regulator